MKKSDKGLVSEALAQAHFAKDPDLIVFTALGGVGPIDLVVFILRQKNILTTMLRLYHIESQLLSMHTKRMIVSIDLHLKYNPL